MRTFVEMRKLLFSNLELTERLNSLENVIFDRLDDQGYEIKIIRNMLADLMSEEEQEPRRPIGF